MADSVARFLKVIRQRPSAGLSESPTIMGHQQHSDARTLRLSGTTTDTETNVGQSTELGTPIGRMGNDWVYPDNESSVINQDPGDRLQDFANTHLGEGPNPGRIPRFWNDRVHGKVGRNLTGNPSGDIGFAMDITGQADGGIGDAKYIEHIQIPRGSVVARAFARTVDDSANIPGIYVSDPTRR